MPESDSSTSKVCIGCGVRKSTDEFHRNVKRRCFHSRCKPCFIEHQIARLRTKRYGVTPEQYDAMLEEQSFGCKICGSTSTGRKRGKYFDVDHDHETGVVRGLVCLQCNHWLYHLGDSTRKIKRLIAYACSHETFEAGAGI